MKIYATTTEDGGLSYAAGSLKQRKEYLLRLGVGKLMEVEIKRHRPQKTHQQCKAYFGIVVRTVVETLKDRGWTITKTVGGYEFEVEPTTDEVKSLLYSVVALPEGKTISKMDTVELADYYRRCAETFAREPWYITIMDPDPNWNK